MKRFSTGSSLGLCIKISYWKFARLLYKDFILEVRQVIVEVCPYSCYGFSDRGWPGGLRHEGSSAVHDLQRGLHVAAGGPTAH